VEREPLFELRRTTFDTPEFRGIEFIEAEVKTILNHVPGNYLPFNWTINPYRGCSHACVYCLSGETPILMLDGRTKPLAEVRVGDEVYGTSFDAKYRRYVPSRVLAHWSTVKPGYRVTLADGTEVITSGDHRFLSNRGWKFVTGKMSGAGQRPYLTTSNSLVGTGRFAEPPKDTADYRRGYLCGMIRGDGTLGSYPNRTGGDIHSFRLALVDTEGLDRTSRYLSELGVECRPFLFSPATDRHRAVHAIRHLTRRGVESIREVIAWPEVTPDAWVKGFLAGIFDAEGGYSQGVLRISNTDPEIISRLRAGLATLGFRFVVETPARGKRPMMVVRLTGGRNEHVRFFLTIDPAITRKRRIPDGAAIKHIGTDLRVVSIEPLGFDLPMYDITTTTGDFIANGVVSHNCFARTTHTFMDMDAGKDFETKIVVKVNGPEVLRRQLGAKKWKGEHVAMGTATDPYQRAEGRYKLMPKIISALTDYRNPFSILTKGTLILRDLDMLVDAAKVTSVSTAFSIGTLDEDAWRLSEPGTPHPRKRIEAIAALNAAGIPAGVLMAPILPGITDRPDQLREVAAAAIDAGATHVSPILLHLRPGIREEYMPWLAENYPDLVPRYQEMYSARSGYAGKADQRILGDRVRDIVRNLGGPRPSSQVAARFRREDLARARAERARREPASQQLSLLEPPRIRSARSGR
jgi:DNA repair photolyase